MWEDKWASLKARERERRGDLFREREASWEWTMRDSMEVGATSELQREIRHMRYERERAYPLITSHLSDIPPVSSPLSLFFSSGPFNCLCCYEECWRGRVSEIQSEREKQTPGVFLSILSNQSRDQYRCKPACGSLLPLVLNTVHGLLPNISTIIYWILEKSHSGLLWTLRWL